MKSQKWDTQFTMCYHFSISVLPTTLCHIISYCQVLCVSVDLSVLPFGAVKYLCLNKAYCKCCISSIVLLSSVPPYRWQKNALERGGIQYRLFYIAINTLKLTLLILFMCLKLNYASTYIRKSCFYM